MKASSSYISNSWRDRGRRERRGRQEGERERSGSGSQRIPWNHVELNSWLCHNDHIGWPTAKATVSLFCMDHSQSDQRRPQPNIGIRTVRGWEVARTRESKKRREERCYQNFYHVHTALLTCYVQRPCVQSSWPSVGGGAEDRVDASVWTCSIPVKSKKKREKIKGGVTCLFFCMLTYLNMKFTTSASPPHATAKKALLKKLGVAPMATTLLITSSILHTHASLLLSSSHIRTISLLLASLSLTS